MTKYSVILFLNYIIYYAESDLGSGYGTEWLYFVDDNKELQVMNFTTLPETRTFIPGNVYFHLYTRNNKDNPELLVTNEDATVNSKYFNESNNIKAVTHGWLSSDDVDWIQEIKDELLLKDSLNVITIDWSEISKNLCYPWPALSTRYVGKQFSKLLNSMKKSYDIKGSNMHFMGHSLGAHVMGYAGKFYGDRIFRITAMDPARPLFEFPLMPPEYRLDKTDADHVEIIHTSAGEYGYENSYGHSDFYPNGGKAPMPGCEGSEPDSGVCSHSRSHEYFSESILSENGFQAYRCESYQKYQNGDCNDDINFMGYHANPDNTGNFYLQTRNQSRFSYS